MSTFVCIGSNIFLCKEVNILILTNNNCMQIHTCVCVGGGITFEMKSKEKKKKNNLENQIDVLPEVWRHRNANYNKKRIYKHNLCKEYECFT